MKLLQKREVVRKLYIYCICNYDEMIKNVKTQHSCNKLEYDRVFLFEFLVSETTFFHSRYCFSYDLLSMDLSLTIQQYFSKYSLFCFVVSSKAGMDLCDVTVLCHCGQTGYLTPFVLDKSIIVWKFSSFHLDTLQRLSQTKIVRMWLRCKNHELSLFFHCLKVRKPREAWVTGAF